MTITHGSAIPDLWLQIALVACLITALACGRAAERDHAPLPGMIAVTAGIVAALLGAILITRGS